MEPIQTNDFDIKRYWEILRRWRYTALAIALAVVSIVTWGSFFWPETYETSSTFVVEKSSFLDPLIRDAGVSGTLEERIKNLKGTLTSRGIIQKAVEKTDLAKNLLRAEAAIDHVRKNIKVTAKGSEAENNTFTVSYAGNDPRFVRDVVNALVSEYAEESLNNQRSEAAGAYDFIRKQLKEYSSKLEESDRFISIFREKYPHFVSQGELMFRPQNDGLQSREVDTNIRLKELSTKRDSLQKQLSGDKQIAAADVVKEGSPQARLNFLNNQLALLNVKFTDRHPEIIKVKDEIAELKTQISQAQKLQQTSPDAAELNPVYQQVKEELQKTDAEIESLKIRYAELRRHNQQAHGVSEQMPGAQEEWSKLQRDRNEDQKIYDDLLLKLEKARVTNDLELAKTTAGITVTDSALLPRYPVRPDRVRLIIFGIVLGIVSGIGTAILLENLNKSYKDEESVESDLKLTVLAAIPEIQTSEDKISERRLDKRVLTCAVMYSLIIGLVLVEELLAKFTNLRILHL